MDTEFEQDLFKIGDHPRTEFFNLGTAHILDWIILCCDGAALCVVGYLAVSMASTH